MAARLTRGQTGRIAHSPNSMSAGDAGRPMGAGRERAGRIRRGYAATGRVPGHGRPGRRKKRITRTTVRAVPEACAGHRCGAVRLEGILAARGNRVPHSTVHAMPGAHGLARKGRPGQRRSLVGHEGAFSNSMWHSGWKRPRDGRRPIAYGGGASRPIAGHGVFGRATPANAVLVLRRAIGECGKPASIITDHGTRPCAVDAGSRRRARHGVRVPGGKWHTPRAGARRPPAGQRRDREALRHHQPEGPPLCGHWRVHGVVERRRPPHGPQRRRARGAMRGHWAKDEPRPGPRPSRARGTPCPGRPPPGPRGGKARRPRRVPGRLRTWFRGSAHRQFPGKL